MFLLFDKQRSRRSSSLCSKRYQYFKSKEKAINIYELFKMHGIY